MKPDAEQLQEMLALRKQLDPDAPDMIVLPAEPVATLPACLCGLDTNPVASPRMDIHCPKHDGPEAGGEPELPHEVTIVGCPHQPLSLWPPTCVVQHVDNELQVATYTRVSQPAGEPSDGPLLTREQYQEQCKRPFYPGRDIHRYVGSKAPGQACETCDLSWVHENHGRMISMVAAAQPPPTPADEETVLRMISDSLSLDSLEILPARELKVLQDRITTALAEARRAGTPTTDERERQFEAEHQAALIRRDGFMCEAHPGLEFEHDPDCAGPGMPWIIEGRDAIASALSSTPKEQEENNDVK